MGKLTPLPFTVLCLFLLTGGCRCGDDMQSDWELDDDLVFDAAAEVGEDVADAAPSCEDEFEPGEPLANCCGRLPERSTAAEGLSYSHDILLGPTGCPRVSYEGDRHFKLAEWDGMRWKVDVIEQARRGGAHQMQLDSHGRPSLAYVDALEKNLMYARRDDQGEWHHEQITSFDPRMPGVRYELDDQDRPHVAVVRHINGGEPSFVEYYTRGDQGWSKQQVFEHDQKIFAFAEIDFDASGTPHLMFQVKEGYNSSSRIAHLQQDDGAPVWHVEPVEHPLAHEESYLRFLFDHDGNLNVRSCDIRYGPDEEVPALAHALRDGDDWHGSVLVAEARNIRCGDIFLDGENRVHIVWGLRRAHERIHARMWMEMFHAVWDGQQWTTRALDGRFRPPYISVAVDARLGVLHVVSDLERDAEYQEPVTSQSGLYVNFPVE